jgi:hypothetical protein
MLLTLVGVLVHPVPAIIRDNKDIAKKIGPVRGFLIYIK